LSAASERHRAPTAAMGACRRVGIPFPVAAGLAVSGTLFDLRSLKASCRSLTASSPPPKCKATRPRDKTHSVNSSKDITPFPSTSASLKAFAGAAARSSYDEPKTSHARRSGKLELNLSKSTVTLHKSEEDTEHPLDTGCGSVEAEALQPTEDGVHGANQRQSSTKCCTYIRKNRNWLASTMSRPKSATGGTRSRAALNARMTTGLSMFLYPRNSVMPCSTSANDKRPLPPESQLANSALRASADSVACPVGRPTRSEGQSVEADTAVLAPATADIFGEDGAH
jgi:hypothetical protein